MQLTTKQVQNDVPVWDVLIDGEVCGCITQFPGEGPMATVKIGYSKRTMAAATVLSLINEIGLYVREIEMIRRRVDIDGFDEYAAERKMAIGDQERVYDESDYFNEEEEYCKHHEAMYWKADALGYNDINEAY